eukprot:scaffold16723_cov143-Isochrysis_galbana.AAC.14
MATLPSARPTHPKSSHGRVLAPDPTLRVHLGPAVVVHARAQLVVVAGVWVVVPRCVRAGWCHRRLARRRWDPGRSGRCESCPGARGSRGAGCNCAAT